MKIVLNGARKFNNVQAAKSIKTSKRNLNSIHGKRRKNAGEKITSLARPSIQSDLFPPQGAVLLPPLGMDSHHFYFTDKISTFRDTQIIPVFFLELQYL